MATAFHRKPAEYLPSYGETGYQIICRTLQYLYPHSSLDHTSFAPLSWDTLIQQVLLPEATVLLIQEDLKFDRDKAIKTLFASQRFGIILHSDDDNPHLHQVLVKIAGLFKASGSRDEWDRSQKGKEVDVKREEVEDQDSTYVVHEVNGQEVLEILD